MLAKNHARQGQLPVPGFAVEPPDTARRRLLLRIDALIDFEFVRQHASPFFSADRGRPSLDPVAMVKMMLVGYVFNVASDRALVEHCADSLAVREFIGYELDQPLPVHSSFTHWRQRLGAEFFREVLHEIARQCVAKGMALSQARTVDGTFVKAQASKWGPRVAVPAAEPVDEYLQAYFAGDAALAPPGPEETRAVNVNDPEAHLQQKHGQPADFGYQASFCGDADSGLVTDATATPRERAQTAVDHVDHDPFAVNELAADSLYDSSEALAQLQARGVTPYVPQRSPRPSPYFGRDQFGYDAHADEYICPAGKRLQFRKLRKGRRHYESCRADCSRCPLKGLCTHGRCRTVTRACQETAREATVRDGPRYEYLQRRRHVNEYLNSLGKRQYGLRRARGLGLAAMQIQACLVGCVINLTRLVQECSPVLAANGATVAALVWRLVTTALLRSPDLQRRGLRRDATHRRPRLWGIRRPRQYAAPCG
jgi:IS5 family transposase